MKLILPILASACLIAACTQAPKQASNTDTYTIPQVLYEPVIENFLPGIKSKMVQQFTFTPGKGGTVTTKEGSEIIVPANCFVYADGTPVQDNVDVAFSQFDNPIEIIASGIPMTMKVNGEDKAFESAGMFEVNGTCKGKSVSVAKDKNITVNLKTGYKDTDYNFYKFNTEANKWVTLETSDKLAARTTVQTNNKTKVIDIEKPVVIEAYNSATPVFELSVNTKTLDGMEGFDNILWTYAGAGSDPFKTEGFFKTKWQHTSVVRSSKKENAYDVVCEAKDKKFETSVKPVLFGSQLKRAQQVYQKLLAEYNRKIIARQNAEKEEAIKAKAVRMLNVSSFGIYNCDRFGNAPTIRVAGFSAHLKDNQNFSTTRYYLVTPSVNAAVYIYDAKNFSMRPDEENYILALMENNKVAIALPEHVAQLKNNETGDLTFKVSDKTLDDNTDFSSLLASAD